MHVQCTYVHVELFQRKMIPFSYQSESTLLSHLIGRHDHSAVIDCFNAVCEKQIVSDGEARQALEYLKI